jgi:iron complex transport system ATP-binding protein
MTRLTTLSLDAGYRNRPVLSAISLSVMAGEILALIGPNGAGKTTLLRALARQLRPTAGAVLLDGIDLWKRGPGWVARRIALAPQGKTPEQPLTVAEAVALGRAPHRGWLLPWTHADREAINRALDRAGLNGFAERLVTELSAGEAQRVVLARALAQEPVVLLVDEPTSHLDLRYQGELFARLRQLASAEGMGIVLALHDLNLAGLWADRIALLADGRLLGLGTPEEVLTRERLESAYATSLSVTRHPVFGTPLVLPLPHSHRPGAPGGT